MKERTEREVISWLMHEYAQPFEGWDFPYLTGRRNAMGVLPWDYGSIALGFLTNASSILDVDTGGGEILSKLLRGSNFKGHACAVEAYAPNVQVARKRLESLDVEVYDTSQNSPGFDDGTFDLVLDRHGGSLRPTEIHRILRRGGHLITEQIGDRTNTELRELFGAKSVPVPDWPHNTEDAAKVFSQLGFATERLDEHSYPVRYLDVGALVYYLKAIPWEVPDFSIPNHSEILLRLHRRSSEQGFAIDATYHAYLLVARKL
jgi:SAM-dependent methyltransferase